jgi:outer membrane lipoprotein carrier protein
MVSIVRRGISTVWLAGAAMLLSAYPPTRLPAQDPWPILDGADAAYQRVGAFSADFVQVVTNPLVGEPDTTWGKLYQKPPSLFAMRFTRPKGDRIVADGRSLWLYTPSTTPGQVIRTPIPAVGTTGPNLFGQFVDHARERYGARYVRADTLAPDGIADVIALDPKDQTLPYRGAVIWIARSDSLVRRMEIAEVSGQQRIVILRRLQAHGDVPASEFKFSVPHGVQVIDQ